VRCRALLNTLGRIGKFPTQPKWVKTEHGHRTSVSYLSIEVAYGRPRLEIVLKSGGAMNISPRLPAGQMMTLLESMGAAGLKARYKELKNL
jgi:hypothetical protein